MDAGDRAGVGGNEVPAAEPGVAEAGKGYGTEEAERSLRRAREAEWEFFLFGWLSGRYFFLIWEGGIRRTDGRSHHSISDIESILNS
jgi:hypothetical protein